MDAVLMTWRRAKVEEGRVVAAGEPRPEPGRGVWVGSVKGAAGRDQTFEYIAVDREIAEGDVFECWNGRDRDAAWQAAKRYLAKSAGRGARAEGEARHG
jgi:hypothetical protein